MNRESPMKAVIAAVVVGGSQMVRRIFSGMECRWPRRLKTCAPPPHLPTESFRLSLRDGNRFAVRLAVRLFGIDEAEKNLFQRTTLTALLP